MKAVAKILAVALNTFREAIRDRILYVILAFALGLIGVSRLLSMLTVGSEEKILKDLGLFAISLFGLLTAVFVGVSLVYKELEKRTLYTLLANPVRRSHFVIGKFFGLLALIGLNTVLMTLALAALLAFHGGGILALLPAIWLTFVELALITAFAILFSSYTNPILAALGTVTVYVSGHLAWSLPLLAKRLPEGFGQSVCRALYWVMPSLDKLNIRAEAVHGLPIDPGFLAQATLYGLGYTAVVLILACLIFERREFL